MNKPRAALSRRVVLWMAAAFATVHVVYLLLGLRFDSTPLTYSWQFIDVELMQTRLLESCFYLHGQPPGFSLFLGSVVKLFGDAHDVALHAFFLGFGLVLYGAVYALLRMLDASRGVAFTVSTLFMASPAFVLYEHYLFYTVPVTAMLAVSALLFYKTLSRERVWWSVGFFFVLFLLCVTRSLFHIVFFVAAAGVLLVFTKHRRRVLVTSLVFFLAVSSLYAKNQLLFGKFTASTWLGMNTWRMVGRHISPEDRRKLVHEGKLSELALVRWFSPLEDYPSEYVKTPVHEDIPVLAHARKSTGGVNYNHEAYIPISDQCFRDALGAVRHRPKALAIGLASSWFVYFTAASDYGLIVEENVAAAAPVKCVYDYAFYGKLPTNLSKLQGFPTSNTARYLYAVLLIGLPLLWVFGLRAGFRGRIGAASLSPARRALVLYLCGTILYVAFIGNCFEGGENNRFRFMTDPMYLALLGVFLHFRLIPWLRRLARRGTERTDEEQRLSRTGP